MGRFLIFLLLVGLSALSFSACASIDSSLLEGQNSGGTSGAAGSSGDSGAPDGSATGGTGGTGGETCVPSTETCDGTDQDCDGVGDSVDDDAHAACELIVKNAIAFCSRVRSEWVCVNEECIEGSANCDGDPSNGCETYCVDNDGGLDDAGSLP